MHTALVSEEMGAVCQVIAIIGCRAVCPTPMMVLRDDRQESVLIIISVRGLPRSTTAESLTALFSAHGTVYSLKLATDIFSGDCKGFATISMEGHEARPAIAALNHSMLDGNSIKVELDRPRKGRGGRRR